MTFTAFFLKLKPYWLAISGGRFCNNFFIDIVVFNDSIFRLNKLGVTVGIILIYFLK